MKDNQEKIRNGFLDAFDLMKSAVSSPLEDTAVSTKVVPEKCKSVRDNVDWHYG